MCHVSLTDSLLRLLWQKEVGFIIRERIRWIPKKPICNGGGAEFVTVNMKTIEPPIILLLVGYALSLLILVAEILVKYLENKFYLRPLKIK